MTDDETPRAMMTLDEVLATIRVGRATLHRMESRGQFPPGFFVAGNQKRWFASDVVAWQKALPETGAKYLQARQGHGGGKRPRLVHEEPH